MFTIEVVVYTWRENVWLFYFSKLGCFVKQTQNIFISFLLKIWVQWQLTYFINLIRDFD